MNLAAARSMCRSSVFVVIASLAACIRIETAPAYVRVLDASPDYDSLDLYVDEERVLAGVDFESISGYQEVSAGDATFEFTKAGIASTLSTRDESLDSDAHVTFIAYGPTGGFATLLLEEDRDEADSGEALVQFVSTATDAGSLDVYLTGASEALEDVSPVIGTLEAGNLDPDTAVTVDRGTWRLRVLAGGSKTDVRLDVSGITLASRSVTTIIVTGTTGGVLVNAIVLPQQGEMTMLRNTNARIRTAVGIEDVTNVTIDDGDTTLTTGVPYTTVTGYRLVDAGAHSLDIHADGTSLLLADVTLEAGSNYTLLLYGSASAPTHALLEDVERLPDDGRTAIRLVNAMWGLGAPISVAVAYYPLIERVAVGEASGYVETDASSDTRLDVTNASTATTLYYQTGVVLDASALYSLVMFGSASATTGVLRRDR